MYSNYNSIRGKVKLIIKSRNYNKIFELTVKKREQFHPPFNWVKIFNSTDDAILTLCDYKYDKKEYISDYQNLKNCI